jgi:hypothetical protein
MHINIRYFKILTITQNYQPVEFDVPARLGLCNVVRVYKRYRMYVRGTDQQCQESGSSKSMADMEAR